jgi:hypothetical protein
MRWEGTLGASPALRVGRVFSYIGSRWVQGTWNKSWEMQLSQAVCLPSAFTVHQGALSARV